MLLMVIPLRFFLWFSDLSITWVRKTYFIQHTVSSMLRHDERFCRRGNYQDAFWAPTNVKDSFH
ncbi:hypothetical protein BDM02DRAFT_2309698 [Thelephora ganbajun]|uniref:Uncharacterized protein n=1 Tax=Thelephora ganbajun TaxID=370292 RepID=A0ACB6YYA2_THEGA|nr:hypothetical protein BDM02DRAFT_2309698 [Thelephora ganbajun]